MYRATSRDRLTTAGAVAPASAAGAVLALWVYRVLWVQNSGTPAALDANENAAVFAWLVGWLLLICAAGAAVVLLASVIGRISARRPPLIDLVALGATAALIMAAIALAPLWATTSV
ncbi:hypothetical protein [Microbacterium sp. PRC9]|uniref:hypothetical protein n=1 Tax=Microbacterium sp. PRC9 TaxID=2962591 RepID=UPI00288277F1|nr:hypothetical protein [Microbacterium sp. PRC9]MDT0140936.1 hypothetical protein [Microbacterium sp. PRC9]